MWGRNESISMNNFRGDLTDVHSIKQNHCPQGTRFVAQYKNSETFFKIILIFFLKYFDPTSICFGDLNVLFPGWPDRFFG